VRFGRFLWVLSGWGDAGAEPICTAPDTAFHTLADSNDGDLRLMAIALFDQEIELRDLHHNAHVL
jgi:hypothetical protein